MSKMHPLPKIPGIEKTRLEENGSLFPVPVAPIRTVGDLVVEAGLWTELPEQARRVLKANIRTAGFIAASSRARTAGSTDRPDRGDVLLASVPSDVSWLNEHLFTYPAALHGVSENCRNLSVSGLRRVLRRFDLIEPYPTPSLLPGSRWCQLLGDLEDHLNNRMALTRFAAWCQSNDIEPEQVSRQSLTSFEAFVRTRLLHSDIPRLIRTISKAWRKSATVLQHWPRDPLTAPPRPDRYTLPFTDFPMSFQKDIDALASRLLGTNRRSPFRGDGPRRPMRATTVKIRLYSLRQAASALVLLGRDPATITSLGDLVDEAAFEAILLFYWERSIAARTTPEDLRAGRHPPDEAGVTAQTGAIATALMMVAKHHCKLDQDTIERLRPMAADLQPAPQTQLSQKNRDRLRQFDDPVTRAMLLHLPERLMQRAERPTRQAERQMRKAKRSSLRPLEAARLARVAATIELLLHIPMRIGNLCHLRLGTHLKYADTRGGRLTHIVVQTHETKNHHDVEWAVGPELAAFLDRYIKKFRPLLAGTKDDWLFPAGFENSGSLSECAMAQSINQTVAEEVGAVVNPHLFRCLAARFILERSPGALEDVRLLLGDKTLQVVLAHYSAMEPGAAGRRWDALLRQLRNESVHLLARKPGR